LTGHIIGVMDCSATRHRGSSPSFIFCGME
jgi:hypothetical protein